MTPPLFDPQRNPFDDIRAALRQARRERKNILLDIGGDWCDWCQRLEAFIQSHPELAELRARHYITVKVYIGEDDEANARFFGGLPPFDSVPHLFVYNSRGLLLCSQETESFEDGESYDYAKVRAFLAEWSDWRRSPYDAMPTEELKRRFDQYMRPDGDTPALTA